MSHFAFRIFKKSFIYKTRMTTSINNKSQKNQNQIDKSDSFSSCSVEIKNKICDESQKPLKISI